MTETAKGAGIGLDKYYIVQLYHIRLLELARLILANWQNDEEVSLKGPEMHASMHVSTQSVPSQFLS